MKSGERLSNFELLRILAMYAIILHHLVVHGIFSQDMQLTNTINNIFLISVAIGGKFGVNIFILISGYFLINQSFRISKFLKILWQYFFYSVFILIIVSFFHIICIDLNTLIITLFPLTGFSWFADLYILLYLFFPFLNVMLNNLTHFQYILFLKLGFLIWFGIPTIASFFEVPISMNFSNVVWFSYLYSVGAFIKIYENEIQLKNPGKIAIYSYLLYIFISIFSFSNFHFLIFLISEKNFLILISSICTFLFFKTCVFRNWKIINKIAATVFGVYLLHDNSLTRDFLWNKLLNIKVHYDEFGFIAYALGTSFLILITCILIDLCRITIENYISERYLQKKFLVIKKNIKF